MQEEEGLEGLLLLLVRLEARKVIEGDCWLWTGARTTDGYGQLWLDDKVRYVHRVIAVIELGLIEDSGLCVRHQCGNRACFNPAHLLLGTQADNVQDAVLQGRMAKKLTREDVVEIKRMLSEGAARATLASAYGVSKPTIGQIARGETWTHIPWPASVQTS
jgi:HNH endonuclease